MGSSAGTSHVVAHSDFPTVGCARVLARTLLHRSGPLLADRIRPAAAYRSRRLQSVNQTTTPWGTATAVASDELHSLVEWSTRAQH